jgi:hypothetical protein
MVFFNNKDSLVSELCAFLLNCVPIWRTLRVLSPQVRVGELHCSVYLLSELGCFWYDYKNNDQYFSQAMMYAMTCPSEMNSMVPCASARVIHKPDGTVYYQKGIESNETRFPRWINYRSLQKSKRWNRYFFSSAMESDYFAFQQIRKPILIKLYKNENMKEFSYIETVLLSRFKSGTNKCLHFQFSHFSFLFHERIWRAPNNLTMQHNFPASDHFISLILFMNEVAFRIDALNPEKLLRKR